jgi:hypothetical protein
VQSEEPDMSSGSSRLFLIDLVWFKITQAPRTRRGESKKESSSTHLSRFRYSFVVRPYSVASTLTLGPGPSLVTSRCLEFPLRALLGNLIGPT